MSIGLQRGLVRVVARDSSGNAIASASLTISDQGATVSVATSGTDPLTVSVFDVGSLSTTGSTVKINTGTTTYTATVVDENTVTISGFAGTLAVSLLDRLVNSGSTPSLQLSSQSASAVDSAPTTGSDGAYSAYVRGGAYDVTITKAGITTQLLRDIWVEADEKRINTFPTTSAAVLYRIDAVRSATWAATDTLLAVSIAGTDKFKVDGTGGFTAAQASTITAGGLTISAGGATITGNSTITGTLTGLTGLTVSSGTVSLPAGEIGTDELAANAVTTAAVTTTDATDNVFTAEEVLVTSSSITITASNVVTVIEFNGSIAMNGGTSVVTLRLRRGGVGGTLLYTWRYEHNNAGAGDHTIPISLHFAVNGEPSGAQTYTITGEETGAGTGTILGSTVAVSRIVVYEVKK